MNKRKRNKYKRKRTRKKRGGIPGPFPDHLLDLNTRTTYLTNNFVRNFIDDWWHEATDEQRVHIVDNEGILQVWVNAAIQILRARAPQEFQQGGRRKKRKRKNKTRKKKKKY